MNTDNNKVAEIILSEEVANGLYSNLAFIAHSSSEFIVDFAQMLPGMPKPTVKSRIILTAEHAKRLLLALQDNIKKYETQFGKIDLEQQNQNIIPPLPFGHGEA